MVDGRVVERPCGGHRFLKLEPWNLWQVLDNLRLGGTLKWEVETAGWEGQGVVCRKMAPLRL
jgi:hypothetical protein